MACSYHASRIRRRETAPAPEAALAIARLEAPTHLPQIDVHPLPRDTAHYRRAPSGGQQREKPNMSLLCSGRVAIVTGAGRGIGREHALALAAHGAKVVVNDLGTSGDGVGSDETPAQEVVRAIKERGGEAVVNTDNVADFIGAKRLIDQAIDTFGKLDVLVNNAGILRDRVLVNMMEPEWDAVIEVHLKGTFAPSRHAAAYWRNKSKEIDGPVHARIINT